MRAFCSRLVAVYSVVALGVVGLVPCHAAAAGETLALGSGIALRLAADWSSGPARYSNAHDIFNVPAGTAPTAVTPRLIVSVEDRLTAEDAVRRLQSIAAESTTTAAVLAVCGWPGLERKYLVPVERPGRDEATAGSELSLRVTTAVAVDRYVVRLQGAVPAGMPDETADAMLAVGRGLECPVPADPAAVDRALELLRQPVAPRALAPRRAQAAAEAVTEDSAASSPGVAQQLQTGVGEIEVAVSQDGQNIVMAANSGFSTSTDGGVTFSFRGGTPNPPGFFSRNGDPSLGVGQSGAFYYAFIGFPQGAGGAATQCSTTVGRSTDGGMNFTTFSNATLCDNAGTTCFPDQEHIAADRVNAAVGGDMVYSTWRNFSGGNCNATAGPVIPTLVCSRDSGATWPSAALVGGGAGDFPRVTVGQDGFVYVVYRSGGNVMLDKFSACNAATPLQLQAGFPATVSAVTDVVCPVPGLDRCNNGNLLSSHTVAVDDTNANHVYVAFANDTGGGNADVMVTDSTTGGTNGSWSAPVRVNANVTGVRFMPWVCSVGGAARVSWYDRRAAVGGVSNDLTDYYCGSATGSGAGLAAGVETNLTNNPDPQCASGWPCAPRATGDSDNCTVQPQLAGVCCQVALSGSTCPAGQGSGNRCDFSAGGCPAGEACQTGGGCPKYGDYSGNACAAGRIYNAWSSATAPAGLPAPGGLAIFYDYKLANTAGVDLSIAKTDAPDPVIAGTNLIYTITATNNDTIPALQVQVDDNVPAGTTFVSLTAPAGFSCTTPPVGGVGLVSCARNFTPPGDVMVFTLEVAVPASTPDGTLLSNTATVVSADPNPNPNDSATATTTVITRADLAITKAGTPDPVLPGGNLFYTIDVVNNGPSDAQNVVVTQNLPPETTFVAVSAPAGWNCVTPPVGQTGTVTCTLPTLPVNGTATFIICVRVSPLVAPGQSFGCDVTVTSATVDPNPDNNSADVQTEPFLPIPTARSAGVVALAVALAGVGIGYMRRRRPSK